MKLSGNAQALILLNKSLSVWQGDGGTDNIIHHNDVFLTTNDRTEHMGLSNALLAS